MEKLVKNKTKKQKETRKRKKKGKYDSGENKEDQKRSFRTGLTGGRNEGEIYRKRNHTEKTRKKGKQEQNQDGNGMAVIHLEN